MAQELRCGSVPGEGGCEGVHRLTEQRVFGAFPHCVVRIFGEYGKQFGPLSGG